jgi:hypothetical protein
VDVLLEDAAAGPQADPAVLWAGAASRLPEPAESAPALGEGDANAPLTLLSGQPPTAFSRRWVARGLAVRADPSGRAWLLLYGPAEGRAELLSAEITVRR